MTIHTFGAYFGLVLSRVLHRPRLEKSKHRQGSVYHSDLFAMIGEACRRGLGRGAGRTVPRQGLRLPMVRGVLAGKSLPRARGLGSSFPTGSLTGS